MRHPQDTPTVIGQLEADPLAHIAETIQGIVGQKTHVKSFR
jgi:hypothetical protein